ncbi:MAG: 2-C-methyl-D-erythritol 4-phosphate cytidylyltransferase, partial [Rhodomicrobium sp.]
MQIQDQKQGVHATIIVAAGSGVRAGLTQGRPKQYCDAGGKPILRRTLEAFINHPQVHLVVAVIRAADEDLYEEAIRGLRSEKLLKPALGGATRQLSVAAGLDALASFSPDAVLI